VVRAPKGKKLVVADLNAIENRVLGWLTDCQSILDVFRKGLCPYKDFATRFFHITYDEVTAALRTLSKPPVLGCGYMLGGGEEVLDKDKRLVKTGLWAYADSMGVNFTRDESHSAVQIFREAYPEVVKFWEDIDNAFRQCIITGQSQRVKKVVVHRQKMFICIRLPSGRDLFYYKPSLKMKIPPWEIGKKHPKLRETICYWGQDQQSKQWVEQTTHPGKLTENIDQAISRDILNVGIARAMSEGIDVRGHVHDEIIALADENDSAVLNNLIGHMTASIWWAPDLPLGAAGFEGKVYRKD